MPSSAVAEKDASGLTRACRAGKLFRHLFMAQM